MGYDLLSDKLILGYNFHKVIRTNAQERLLNFIVFSVILTNKCSIEVNLLITRELATVIVRETMLRTNFNINVMDVSGHIIASGDPSRLGDYHAAAAYVIRQGQELLIDESNQSRWKGSQPGLNLPIIVHGQVVGAIGISGRIEEISPVAQLVKMTTELMIKQSQLKLQQEWRQLHMDWVLKELVEGTGIHEGKIDQRLQAIGCIITAPYQAIVIEHEPSLLFNTEERFFDVMSRRLAGRSILLSAYRPHRTLLLCYGNATSSLSSMLDQVRLMVTSCTADYCIGVGSLVQSLYAVRSSFEEAEAVLRYPSNKERVLTYRQAAGPIIINELPSPIKEKLIYASKEYWNKKIEETLEAFFSSDLNMAEAAKLLGIHRNTMQYRLEQIHKQSGYNPQKFQEAHILQWIVWLQQALRAEGGGSAN
ncbi:transcriptional regulator [Paenibacillus mucilaginosus]|nr:transcriptional regulator [Paenibacillus mucilaginosus]